jgi:hypothetical protein
MAIAEGVKPAEMISFPGRFAMRQRVRTKTRPSTSHLATTSIEGYLKHRKKFSASFDVFLFKSNLSDGRFLLRHPAYKNLRELLQEIVL